MITVQAFGAWVASGGIRIIFVDTARDAVIEGFIRDRWARPRPEADMGNLLL